jgi:predicted dehydrogenase
VLCEKPFSRRPEEVERAFGLTESAGLVLSEGFMWRHHPQSSKLAQLVTDGAIGRLRLVRAAFSFQLAAEHGADDTRFRPELDGGSLMDVGCYCVNAIRLLAGEPERVRGDQVVGASGADVCFAATLRLPDDVLAHFDCGFVLPYRDELKVVGESGSLYVEDPWHIRSPGIELRDGDRDAKFSRAFDALFRGAGMRVIRTPLKAPNANAHIERWVGSVRRECLDRLLILGRRQLDRVLRIYVRHYNEHRPHRALDLQTPDPGRMPSTRGTPAGSVTVIQRRDLLGGLIHEYGAAAA